MEIWIEGERVPARVGLMRQIESAWERIARPGTWWTGYERVAIAAEVRQAHACRFCRTCKSALSPYTVPGKHDKSTDLSEEAIDAVHRIATDAGRLTRTWVQNKISGPLGEESYIEIVSITAIVTALDTFDRALGRPPRMLPEPRGGEPDRRRPGRAKRNLAWVATVAPEDIGPADHNPYAIHGDKNIHRALSLVPQEVSNFFDLDVELYLRDEEIRDFSNDYRAISHAQIELIAGRASAINACYY